MQNIVPSLRLTTYRLLQISQCSSQKIIHRLSLSSSSSLSSPSSSSSFVPSHNHNISLWLEKYEDVVGLTEVRNAQNKVLEAERLFQKIQSERRSCQLKLTEIQNRLKDIHGRLEKFQRGDERYLSLLTEEYDVLRNEKVVLQDLRHWEQAEQDHFASLSSALRESHEKERARAERTKYWSVVGSIIGAAIGIVGSSINNFLKTKELKGMVTDVNIKNQEIKSAVGELSKVATEQYGQTVTFLSDLHTLLMDGKDSKVKLPLTLANQDNIKELSGEELLRTLRLKEPQIDRETAVARKLVGVVKDGEENVVVVGEEISNLLNRMETDLEWKIKKSALMSSVLLYGAGFVTLAVMYSIAKAAS